MMVTRQELEGKWTQIKGRLQDRWGQLNDEELQRVRGNANELVGVIQQKTGESRNEIEDFLEQAVAAGSSTVQEAKATVRDYTQQAADSFHENYEQMTESARAGYDQAEQMVHRRPFESVAVAFGTGIITGVILGLVLKSR